MERFIPCSFSLFLSPFFFSLSFFFFLHKQVMVHHLMLLHVVPSHRIKNNGQSRTQIKAETFLSLPSHWKVDRNKERERKKKEERERKQRTRTTFYNSDSFWMHSTFFTSSPTIHERSCSLLLLSLLFLLIFSPSFSLIFSTCLSEFFL